MSRSAAGNRFPHGSAVIIGLFLAVALLMTLASPINAADDFKPTFAYDALSRDPDVLLPLLKVVCGEGVRTVTARGGKALGCGDGDVREILESRHRPRRYEWMPYVLWEADGVLFGHFLSATSDDAVIPCVDCESHPALWGGSLLLTKQDDKWEPVWYKPGVITRHCHKISLETGRQILVCEEPDGGMGHSLHGLYLVDFTKPKFAWDSLVLAADTYGSYMLEGVQVQTIDRVQFDETPQIGLLVRVYGRHGRIGLPHDPARWREGPLPKPKVSNYEIDFRLNGDVFKVTPGTAAAGRLFGVK
jgi:hypothetical protein